MIEHTASKARSLSVSSHDRSGSSLSSICRMALDSVAITQQTCCQSPCTARRGCEGQAQSSADSLFWTFCSLLPDGRSSLLT